MKNAQFFLVASAILGFAGFKCLNSGATPTFGIEEVHKMGIFCLILSVVSLVLGVAIVIVIARTLSFFSESAEIKKPMRIIDSTCRKL